MSTRTTFGPAGSSGGRVTPDPAHRPQTGTWRTGTRPAIEWDRCVHCLLCWAYCPDRAIETRDAFVVGINLNLCKGCEVCAAVCPEAAIVMVADIPDASAPADLIQESR
jgi:2-oxoacid:acceptor oxidoreductase delta subunit (pyruvate/2-ketoisovalerate family)